MMSTGATAGTKRSIMDETPSKSSQQQQQQPPFERLPVYGEHKRAVSAVAVPPSRLTKNRTSYTMDSTPSEYANTPLVASASADGTVKIWDLETRQKSGISAGANAAGEDGASTTAAGGVTSATVGGSGGAGEGMASPSPTSNQPFSLSSTPHHTTSYGTENTPHSHHHAHSSTQQQSFTNSNSHLGQLLSPTMTLLGHSRGINDVTWSQGGSWGAYIATASDDKTLRLWDVNTGDALVEFRGHSNFVFCTKFNPQSSNLLVSGSFDETVKLWDVRTGDCVSTLPAHSDPVTAVDFNRDGTCIVSGSHDGLVRIWDTATGECLKTLYAHGNPPVSHVQYTPNGKYVLAGTLDSKLRLWPLSPSATTTAKSSATGHLVPPKQVESNTKQHGAKCTKLYCNDLHHLNTKYCIVSDFVVSNPKRQCIVTGSESGKLILYDINASKGGGGVNHSGNTNNSGTVHQVLDGHTDAVLAVASHESQEFIVSGGMTKDKTVQFWKPKSSSDASSDCENGDDEMDIDQDTSEAAAEEVSNKRQKESS